MFTYKLVASQNICNVQEFTLTSKNFNSEVKKIV